ncbi:hypothetical protein SELMODRAFT_411224 [Selaginella moellendorffii]|uniref:Uncharacterized protein n=1 Tax=Selaginella moellendorffii TaxID=88036 RepID=D8RGZ0_SELML|nr:hypothetical protein SELMODRAFT_411224 [Selaginella moellendorffii]
MGRDRGKNCAKSQRKEIEHALTETKLQKQRRDEELSKIAHIILVVLRDYERPRQFEYSKQAYALKAIWNYLSDDCEISQEIQDGLFLLFQKLRFPEGQQKIDMELDKKSLKVATSEASPKVFCNILMDGWSLFRQKFEHKPLVVYQAGKKVLNSWTNLEFTKGIQAMKQDLLWKRIVEHVESSRAAASNNDPGANQGEESLTS